MELLTLFPLHDPTIDFHYRLSTNTSALSMAMCGSELTRTELSSIVEVEERDGTRRRDKVFVAVGTSEEKTVSLLQWTFRHFRSCDVCLVHVHRPSTFIPTLCKF